MALSERNDLAITFASLLLHDAGLNITADKLSTVLLAANIDVPAFYARLYARVLANRNIDELLATTTAIVPSSGGAPAADAAASGPAGGAPAKAEEKKEEKKPAEEEEDALGGDEGMSLFGGDDDY